MKKLFLSTALVVISLVIVQCSKEGPAGPAGPEGPEGPQGPRGNNGATGTANVIYSAWLSFQQAERDTIIDGTNVKVNHLPAASMTQARIDNGAILVYMRFLTTVFPLPYTSDAGPGNIANTVSFIPRTGNLLITRYTHNNSGSVGFGAVQFRYIIIPGGVAGGRFADGETRVELNGEIYTEAELKALPYEQVCNLAGINP